MARRVTAALMLIALLLVLAWPLEFGDRPSRSAALPVRKAYAARLALHLGAIVVTLVGAGVGAALVSRQAKQEYREAAKRNMRVLVEGKDPDEA